MNRLLLVVTAVVAFAFATETSQAQFIHGPRGFGGGGFAISVGSGFNNFNNFGYRNFNRGFGVPVRGVSINIGNRGFGGFNRGFYGGVPYYAARPVFVPSVPVYRGYRGFGGGVYRRGCGW